MIVTLTDVDTNSTDYANPVTAVQTAVSAYTGPGAVTFDSTTGALTFTAVNDGDVMAALTVDLSLVDDLLLEGPEDYTMALTGATSTSGFTVAVSSTAASVTTTINDTQGPGGAVDGPAEWSVAGPANIDEGLTSQYTCLLYTSPSPRDLSTSRMPSSA